MTTDQQFINKERKHLTPFEKTMRIIIPLLVIVIGVIATLFLFVFKPDQPCDPIDKVGAWCKVHPFTVWDLIGTILFYVGIGWMSSIIPSLLIKIGMIQDDSSYFGVSNFIALLVVLSGFGLIYLV